MTEDELTNLSALLDSRDPENKLLFKEIARHLDNENLERLFNIRFKKWPAISHMNFEEWKLWLRKYIDTNHKLIISGL